MGSRKVKMMSFDTSSTMSGYAYYENAQLKNFGVVDLKKMNDPFERCSEMSKTLVTMLKEYKPSIVVIESPPFIKDPHTCIMLSKIVGSVMGYSHVNNCTYIEYLPKEWRSLIKDVCEKVPKGRDVVKMWDIQKANDIFGQTLKKGQDDVADAILLGLAYIKQCQISDDYKNVI